MAPRVVTAPAPAATQAARGKRCGHARLSALCAAPRRLSHAREALVHLPRAAIIQKSNACAPTLRSSRQPPASRCLRLTSNVGAHKYQREACDGCGPILISICRHGCARHFSSGARAKARMRRPLTVCAGCPSFGGQRTVGCRASEVEHWAALPIAASMFYSPAAAQWLLG